MTAFIDIDDGGALDGIQRRIEVGIDEINDFRPLWRTLSADWAASREEAFDSQGSSIGQSWPDYTEAERRHYVHFKRVVHGRPITGSDLLRWKIGTERLRPGVVDEDDPNYVPRETDLEPGRAAFGTRVEYASRHNRGQGRAAEWMGGYQIPRRPFIVFDPGFRESVADRLSEFAEEVGGVISGRSREEVGRFAARRSVT